MASATIEETTHDLFSWDILRTCNGYVQVGNCNGNWSAATISNCT